MLAQTKRTIDAMLQAGYERKDFQARCKRHYIGIINGKRCYEYGLVEVTIWNRVNTEECVYALVKTGLLDVVAWYKDDILVGYIVRQGLGTMRKINIDNPRMK